MSYFITVGRGLENLAKSELEQKFGAHEVVVVTGKIFFKTNAPIYQFSQHQLPNISKSPLSSPQSSAQFPEPTKDLQQIPNKSLKSAERLFALVGRRISPYFDTYKPKAMWQLQQITTMLDWKGAFQIWKDANPGISKAPTFRVSAKRSGNRSSHLSQQDIAIAVGKSLKAKLNLSVDLRHYTLEVYVHLNDEMLIVGFPLSRTPVSNRSFIVHEGLRGPVAYSMASLCNIQPNYVVCDPMCGVGSTLIEAALEYSCVCIGVDIDEAQLVKSKENITGARLDSFVELFKGSVTRLPIRTESVDAILSDIPFGHLHLTPDQIRTLYPLMLPEMYRVLRFSRRFVLLTSEAVFLQEVIDNFNKMATNTSTLNNDSTLNNTSTLNNITSNTSTPSNALNNTLNNNTDNATTNSTTTNNTTPNDTTTNDTTTNNITTHGNTTTNNNNTTSTTPTSNTPTNNTPTSNTSTSNTPTSNTPTSNNPTSNTPTSNTTTSNTPTNNTPTSTVPNSTTPNNTRIHTTNISNCAIHVVEKIEVKLGALFATLFVLEKSKDPIFDAADPPKTGLKRKLEEC